MHAQTSTAAGVEGDEKNSPTSGRPQGASNGADVPSDIPAASSSVLDEDFALGEFDAEAEAIALQVQSYHHANPDLCTLCLQLKALWLLLRSSSASTRLHMTPARLPMHAMHAHMLGRLEPDSFMCFAQASGDADFELTQGMLRELEEAEEGADALEANSLDDDEQQGIQLADEATKNQVRSVASSLL